MFAPSFYLLFVYREQMTHAAIFMPCLSFPFRNFTRSVLFGFKFMFLFRSFLFDYTLQSLPHSIWSILVNKKVMYAYRMLVHSNTNCVFGLQFYEGYMKFKALIKKLFETMKATIINGKHHLSCEVAIWYQIFLVHFTECFNVVSHYQMNIISCICYEYTYFKCRLTRFIWMVMLYYII